MFISPHLVSRPRLLQLAEEISKSLASLKEALCGTAEKEPQMEAVAQLAQELYSTNLFVSLIGNLHRIDFEVGGRGGHSNIKPAVCLLVVSHLNQGARRPPGG